MYLIALGQKGWQFGTVLTATKRPMDWSVEEAYRYEDSPGLEGGSANLHR